MKRFILLALYAVIFSVAPGMAQSAMIGYSFSVFSDGNTPEMELTNNSDPGYLIEYFTISIGNTNFNYDVVYDSPTQSGGISYTLISPDNDDGGAVRTDLIEIDFTTGFSPSSWFRFETDIDNDNNPNQGENYATVLYNNGGAPNAVVTVTFSGGQVLSGALQDDGGGSLSQSEETAVPLPGAIWLLGAGLTGLAGFRKRFR